jgi:hypothetical protein
MSDVFRSIMSLMNDGMGSQFGVRRLVRRVWEVMEEAQRPTEIYSLYLSLKGDWQFETVWRCMWVLQRLGLIGYEDCPECEGNPDYGEHEHWQGWRALRGSSERRGNPSLLYFSSTTPAGQEAAERCYQLYLQADKAWMAKYGKQMPTPSRRKQGGERPRSRLRQGQHRGTG